MRPRKKNKELPPCVYHVHGAYWLIRKNKWTRLGKELPKEYRTKPQHGAMAELIDTVMGTIKPNVSKNTWQSYTVAAGKLKWAFADFDPSQIQAADVWDFRDKYSATPNQTNRCLSLLTQILNYAVRRRAIAANPVIGVEKLEEKSRDRLLTSEEVRAIRAQAGKRLQCIIDLLYLTAQRVNDVLRIKRSDLTQDGIQFQQQKTGKKILVRWTPELRAAVEAAKGLSDIPTLTLFQSRYRKAPDYRSIRLQWENACAAAGVTDAQMRDLRAMSLTDAEDEGLNPTALAGHSSPAMTKRYLRSKKVSKVDGPSMKKKA